MPWTVSDTAMNITDTVLGAVAGLALGALLVAAVTTIWRNLVTRPRLFTTILICGYQDALGDRAGRRAARRAARALTRRGHDPRRFWATAMRTAPDRQFYMGAAITAALAVSGLRCPTSTEHRWVTAFAGPHGNGAPLARYLPLVCNRTAWQNWVATVGRPDTALAVIEAGLEPGEATALARHGDLSVESLHLLTALHAPAPSRT